MPPAPTTPGTWTSHNPAVPALRFPGSPIHAAVQPYQWYTNWPGTQTLFMSVTNIAPANGISRWMFSEASGYSSSDTTTATSAVVLMPSGRRHLHDDPIHAHASLRELDAATTGDSRARHILTSPDAAVLDPSGGIQSVGERPSSPRHGTAHLSWDLVPSSCRPARRAAVANPAAGIPGVGKAPCRLRSLDERGCHSAGRQQSSGRMAPSGRLTKQTWVEPGSAQQVPEHSARAVDATIAFTEYVLATYGRSRRTPMPASPSWPARRITWTKIFMRRSIPTPPCRTHIVSTCMHGIPIDGMLSRSYEHRRAS